MRTSALTYRSRLARAIATATDRALGRAGRRGDRTIAFAEEVAPC